MRSKLTSILNYAFFLFICLSTKCQINTLNISTFNIKNSVQLKDYIHSVEVINIGHPSIEKDKSIFLLSASDYMYLAVLGGKTILKLNKDWKVVQDFQFINSTSINFILSIWSVKSDIFVYDSTIATIFKFNGLGQLINKTQLRITNPSSIIGNENFIWLDMNRINIYGSPKPTNYNLAVFDQNMNFLCLEIPYNFNLPVNIGSGITNFSKHGANIYYKQPHSKSIYELKSDSAELIYTFEFEDVWPYDSPEQTGNLTFDELIKIHKDPELLSYHKSWVSNSYVFSEFKVGSKLYYHLINRDNNRQKIFSAPLLNSRISVINWFDNRLALIIKHDDLDQIIKNLSPSKLIQKFSPTSSDNYTHAVIFIEFRAMD